MAFTFWKYAFVDVSNTPVTVASISSLVHGVHIDTTLSANDVVLYDGDNPVFTIPGGSVAGTRFTLSGEPGVGFKNSVVVIPDGAGTGQLTLFYK